VKDWSTMAARGSLSIGLGLAVLLWPAPGLGELVVLFGIYALLDGIAAATWAVRAARRSLDGWPVLLEGVYSVGLGVVALGFPFQSAAFVRAVALWGFVTGTLEMLAALYPARRMALPPWFLAAGGAWSVFLAVLVFGLPHAFTPGVALAIGVYALVFGVLVSLGAFTFRRVISQRLIATVEQT
jgi:uncharacterized membrane protein HdeD (DUF308 family)